MINHLCKNILNEILINYLFVKNVSRLLVKLVPPVYLYIRYFSTSSAILIKRKWALFCLYGEQSSNVKEIHSNPGLVYMYMEVDGRVTPLSELP